MNKAFVKETTDDDLDDAPQGATPIPPGTKNYMTPAGHREMREEMLKLLDVERPAVVKMVSWAASNGDRSENADYIYGKRRLREIDRRIYFLTKRLDIAEVVDSSRQENVDQVFFGATVRYANQDGEEQTVMIVGVDEVDMDKQQISWISPVARALLKARVGDTVTLHTPVGPQQLDILDVHYPAPGGD
jgi:transcription elongation factor GreB